MVFVTLLPLTVKMPRINLLRSLLSNTPTTLAATYINLYNIITPHVILQTTFRITLSKAFKVVNDRRLLSAKLTQYGITAVMVNLSKRIIPPIQKLSLSYPPSSRRKSKTMSFINYGSGIPQLLFNTQMLVASGSYIVREAHNSGSI